MKVNSGNIDAQEIQGRDEVSCLNIRSIEPAGHFDLQCDWTTYRSDI
jgi:hypothetical protein